jgi:hypothetical protein
MALRFKPCDCDAPEFVRERRSTWMRLLLPQWRHWSCRRCGQHFMASKGLVAAHNTSPQNLAGPAVPAPAPR